MYIQDIHYNHLLYNTFGPISFNMDANNLIKIQTNNGTGKTIFLKTILGLLFLKKGIVMNYVSNNNFYLFDIGTRNRLSSSQLKKLKLIKSYLNKHVLWVLDEPYSYLDLTSIHFFKKKIIECFYKRYIILITDCIKNIILPTIIFYFGLKWI